MKQKDTESGALLDLYSLVLPSTFISDLDNKASTHIKSADYTKLGVSADTLENRISI